METRAKDLSETKDVDQGKDKEKTLYPSYCPKEPPSIPKSWDRPTIFVPVPVHYDPNSGRWLVSPPKQNNLPKDVTIVYVPEKHNDKKCKIP
jgi:hypothetical protein